MSTPQWSVVSFEDGVQLVPQNWIVGDECFWPTFTSNMQYEKAVRHCESPESNWPRYEIRILGTFESYDIGKKKLIIAEEHSDLNTDGDEASKKARKLRKRKIISSSDEEETYNLHDFSPVEEFPPTPSCSKIASTIKNVDRQNLSKNNCETVHSGSESLVPSRAYVSQSKAAGTIQPSVSTFSDEDFKSKLLRDIAFIKVNMLKINQRLSLLETKIDPNLPNDQAQTDTDEDKYTEVIQNVFPLNSIEQLNDVEGRLQAEPIFKLKLINYCSKIGGCKVDDITKMILKKLFSNKVASSFSWLGAKKKRVFYSLILAEIIISAVRANKVAAHATEKDIIDSIKNWLRHASTREKNNNRNLTETTDDQ